MSASLHLLVCQYYLREVQEVLRTEGFEGVSVSPYPDLCVRPRSDCAGLVDRLFADNSGQDRTVILVGACYLLGPQKTMMKLDRLHRICHENLCFHMLAGPTLVASYLRAGSHLVTAGWLAHWRQHIKDWQFDQATAQAFFAEGARRMTLLDTGLDPEAEGRLRECARFLNLPADVVPVGLDYLRLFLFKIVQAWRTGEAQRQAEVSVGLASGKLADYVLAMDLLARLSRIMSEEEAIRAILELFAMLFGAGRVAYLSTNGARPGTLYANTEAPDDTERMQAWKDRLKPGEAYATSASGFCVRVAYQNETIGILGADQIALPQREQDYLNLALSIVNLCGLAITNARSISRRQQAEEALRQKSGELARSNADLEQFAFVASHDLQAPLRRIIGFGDLLHGKYAATMDAPARQYLDAMQESSRRMQQLITGLLMYARVKTGSRPLGVVRLPEVVRHAVDDLTQRIQETGGTVEVGELPPVVGDELQLYQLFQNIIGNALKFVPPGRSPRIVVSSQPLADGRLEIRIQDNGIGFEEKYLEKIFQPFQRLHNDREYPGSGIGLAVCQKIVQRHGGTITASSRLGEGSTFVISLPGHDLHAPDTSGRTAGESCKG